MKTEGNPRIFIAIVVAVIGLVLGVWQKNTNAEPVKVSEKVTFCSSYWYAVKLRAGGVSEARAVKTVTEAMPVIMDYRKYGLTVPEDSMFPESAKRWTSLAYRNHTPEEAKLEIRRRPEMANACAEIMAQNNQK